MSQEAIVAFDRHLSTNKALQNKVRALQKNDADGLVRIGAEAGYVFSVKELVDMVKAARQANELSDDQLDRVVGGMQADYANDAPQLPTIQNVFNFQF